MGKNKIKLANCGFDFGTANTLAFFDKMGFYPRKKNVEDKKYEQSQDGEKAEAKSSAKRQEQKMADQFPPVRSVAMIQGDDHILAVGNAAYNYTGRLPKFDRHNPRRVRIARAVEEGRIQDTTVMMTLFETILEQVHPEAVIGNHLLDKERFVNPDLIVLPISGNTETMHAQVMKRAVQEWFLPKTSTAWYRIEKQVPPKPDELYEGRVATVSQPGAGLLGAGLTLDDTKARLVIDIGGGTTNVAVMCGINVVFQMSIPVGGDHMDMKIVDYVYNAHGVRIGVLDAEVIKHHLATAIKPEKSEIKIGSVNGQLRGGGWKTIDLTNLEIFQCLEPLIMEIINGVKTGLDRFNAPQIHGDIKTNGGFLTGGGSLVNKMHKRTQQEIGLTIRRVPNPLYSVILGVQKLIESPELLDKFDLIKIQQSSRDQEEAWKQEAVQTETTPAQSTTEANPDPSTSETSTQQVH